MQKIDPESGSSGEPPPAGSGRSNADPAIAIDSTTLMAGGREIVILHAGERYRLRITANDKLILTK